MKCEFAAIVSASLAILLAGCADTPVQAPAPAPTAAAAPGPATAPSGIVLSPQPEGAGTASALVNDPSAPADTPLCGMAARENNAMGEALLGQQYAEAGICSSFACYDPATATYIGSDGYRHVCR